MSSSSSSCSRSVPRRSVHGVPSKCWCGKGLVIWASETKDNPCRRFYRCEVALQRKLESHLFKWEDEAILDEVAVVDAKIKDLVHDFKSLYKSVTEELATQKKFLIDMESLITSKLHAQRADLDQAMAEATHQIKAEFDAKLTSLVPITHLSEDPPAHKFAAAVAIVGALGWLYWKLF